MSKIGKLYLIPSPLSENVQDVLVQEQLKQIKHIDIFIVERGKTARQFMKTLPLENRFAAMRFFELNKHTSHVELPTFLHPALDEGKDIGLLSEAGCPGIADPGAEIVALAHKSGIQVIPLIGPSSIVLSLMASGLNGQSFSFLGYLPIKGGERKKRLRQLEQQSRQFKQTQIFIETPYRNESLFKDCLSHLSAHTRLCVACDLTAPTELIKMYSIQTWKKQKQPDIHKRPCIFLILA
ncbi:MAG: SAM-dependent methyltransferase [Saprospiraceae bacterium]|nr:SAM-dependent methyltransferase [Saprospiraceae bacterium]